MNLSCFSNKAHGRFVCIFQVLHYTLTHIINLKAIFTTEDTEVTEGLKVNNYFISVSSVSSVVQAFIFVFLDQLTL